MRILDTSQATATTVQPVKAETLNFLQLANKYALADIVNALLGIDTTVSPHNQQVFVLYGCQISGPPASTTVSPGAVVYNGEIFELYGPGGPGTNTFISNQGANVSVVSIVNTKDTNNADPVTFSDQIQRNVHNIRTMQVTSGPSGSGITDLRSYLGFIYPPFSTVALYTAITNEISRAESVEAGIVNGTPGNNISSLSQLTSQLTALQNSVGSVPGGTTVQAQLGAIGTGWQNVTLDTSNVTVWNGGGSFGTAPSGNLNYNVIGNTLMCNINFSFSLSGDVSGIVISAFSGLPDFAYDGATCGIFFNSSALQYQTSVTWNHTTNVITIFPASDQGNGISKFGSTTGGTNNNGRISATIVAQLA